jgi:hypothetical protein
MPRVLFFALFILGLVSLSADVGAMRYKSGEAYAEPSYKELIQTLVMMSERTIKTTFVADEYAKLLYCDLYTEKYKDDFAWNASREKIIDRVSSKKEPYRILYEIISTIHLEKYSFETQDYPFDKASRIVNVSSLAFSTPQRKTKGPCALADMRGGIFPTEFSVLLNQPFTLDRFKIPVGDAEKLLDEIKKESGDKRKVYARFRVRLQSIVDGNVKIEGTKQKRGPTPLAYPALVVFRGELTSIDLFLDRELTKHIANIPVD